MPDFGTAFSGLAARRKVTHQELVRAIRFMIAAEYEAVQLYMQLAESTDNELARAVLKDIADEEIVHAGEFLTLLKELAPEEASFYAEGEGEVRELIAGLRSGAAAEEAVLEKEKKVAMAREEVEGAEVEAEPPATTVGSLFGTTR